MADSPEHTEKEIALLDRRERLRLIASLRRMWRRRIVDTVDQVAVLEKVDGESGLNGRFIFMTLMSAGIAVLGLLQSSPAVVIGAMLLSPLMGPIIGAGLALAVGDARELRRCAKTLTVGTLLAIGITAMIVFMSPIQTVTPEIAARTRPNLFDLLIALFSALAGAYAMIRGREGTIVGVAIATALMPPLAVVGYGLATFNWTVFGGSLMLFITNLMTIALSAAVVARFYGFSTRLTKQQTRLQVIGILVAFAVLAVPLGISLKQIAWEANASRQANSIIKAAFDPHARITQIDIDHDAEPVQVTASVLTPKFQPQAEAETSAALSTMLRKPVSVKIDQYRVGTDPGAAEAAELANARAQAQAEARERQVSDLMSNLSLIAGVGTDQVVVDRDHRRAIVRAQPIPGAGLATYRTLESRIAATAGGWKVEMVPPALPLPDVSFNEDTPDPAAVALIAWASRRVGAPVELTGPANSIAAVRDALAKLGAKDVRLVEARGNKPITARWAAPDVATP